MKAAEALQAAKKLQVLCQKKVKTGDETKSAAYLLLAGASARILLKAVWKKERADLR